MRLTRASLLAGVSRNALAAGLARQPAPPLARVAANPLIPPALA